MQNRKTWSRVAMSGRWRVDTWGAVPNCNNSHLHIDPSLALQAMDIDAILWPPALGWTFQERVLRSFVGHHPPYVYPLSTWRHFTWPHLPGLPQLCICILQATGVGNGLGTRLRDHQSPRDNFNHFTVRPRTATKWPCHPCTILILGGMLLTVWVPNIGIHTRVPGRNISKPHWC